MRIAVLITAYKNLNQLKMLVDHLSKDFDVYVHIDKRSSISIKSSDKVKVFKTFNSYWGSINTVRAVILLLRTAHQKKYDRYMLISGQDIPIKSNRYILDFFLQNNNKEYLEHCKLPSHDWNGGGIDRVEKYWVLDHGRLSGFMRIISGCAGTILSKLYASKLSKYFKRKLEYSFFGGSNYMDLTGHCVGSVLEYIDKNPNYLGRFRLTRIPEEIFFQTIIMNLNLNAIIINKALRYIDWTGGLDHPKTLTIEDYERIMRSDGLFARKFDENEDLDVVKKIYKDVR